MKKTSAQRVIMTESVELLTVVSDKLKRDVNCDGEEKRFLIESEIISNVFIYLVK
jgi:hypothetical protein